jgi:hypothetical protein
MCVTSLGMLYGYMCDNVRNAYGNVFDIFSNILRKYVTSLERRYGNVLHR